MEENVVLCGANAYEKKYYFNEKFNKLPDSIKDELHIICVLFTEEAGGVITFEYDSEGNLNIKTDMTAKVEVVCPEGNELGSSSAIKR